MRKIIIPLAIFAAIGLSACEPRSPAEKAGDAVEEIGEDIGDAVEPAPVTPGEKVGEAVEDAGDDISDAARDVQN